MITECTVSILDKIGDHLILTMKKALNDVILFKL